MNKAEGIWLARGAYRHRQRVAFEAGAGKGFVVSAIQRVRAGAVAPKDGLDNNAIGVDQHGRLAISLDGAAGYCRSYRLIGEGGRNAMRIEEAVGCLGREAGDGRTKANAARILGRVR